MTLPSGQGTNILINSVALGLLWWHSLPANAGDTGSSPGPGRSHMPQSN